MFLFPFPFLLGQSAHDCHKKLSEIPASAHHTPTLILSPKFFSLPSKQDPNPWVALHSSDIWPPPPWTSVFPAMPSAHIPRDLQFSEGASVISGLAHTSFCLSQLLPATHPPLAIWTPSFPRWFPKLCYTLLADACAAKLHFWHWITL